VDGECIRQTGTWWLLYFDDLRDYARVGQSSWMAAKLKVDSSSFLVVARPPPRRSTTERVATATSVDP